MKNPKWVTLVTIVVAVLAIVDSGLFLYIKFFGKFKSADGSSIVLVAPKGVRFPSLDGFLSSGVPAPQVQPLHSNGFAVLYASRNCPYCRYNMPEWHRLSAGLKNVGFTSTVLVPTTNDEYQNVSDRQIVYANTSWISRINLRETPITMVFDSQQKLIWAHTGTMSSADTQRALALVHSMIGTSKP
jgi:hypothetical protein